MKRSHNFSAGPSKLPDEVLERLISEFPDYKGRGYSIAEVSHRSPIFFEVYEKAQAGLREVLNLPDNYQILFLHGGASFQFLMLAYDLLRNGKIGAYINSGIWAEKAIHHAKNCGKIEAIGSGEEFGFFKLPEFKKEKTLDPEKYSYLHMTCNNTVYGTQYFDFPETKVPLVCDISSEVLSRRLPIEKFKLLYGGAQKNMGVAGLGFAIIHKELLKPAQEKDMGFLIYETHATQNCMYNTPNTFAIYVCTLYFDWVKKNGGIDALERENHEKAKEIYSLLDASEFYRTDVFPAHRSIVNSIFRIEPKELEPVFIQEAEKEEIYFLKGHKHIGGLRASMYNATRLESIKVLCDFMKNFEKTKG